MTKTATSWYVKMLDGLDFEETGEPGERPSCPGPFRLRRHRTTSYPVCPMISVTEILATVGTIEKIDYLINILDFHEHTYFSSRDACFSP
jgi:hypothetical protein